MKTTFYIIAILLVIIIYFFGPSKNNSQNVYKPVELNPPKTEGELTLDYLLETYKKPSIFIYRLAEKFQDKDSLSYLGGMPTLPKGIQWPENQHFVAQINLSDLPDNELLPSKGVLFFFVDLHEKGYYHEEKYNNHSTVIFIKSPPAEPVGASPPVDLNDRMQSGSYRDDRDGDQKKFPKWPIGFASTDSHNIEKLPQEVIDQAFDYGVYEDYFNYVALKNLSPLDSMKEKIAKGAEQPHQLLGYSPSRTNPISTNENEVLLLNLVSDAGVSFMFGDLDFLQFYIDKEDLAAQRFDKAWGVAG